MQSVLNVRMDSLLKERGDKVLSDNGVSVSGAVRALWAELVKTRTIPEFMREPEGAEQRKRERLDALERLSLLGADKAEGLASSIVDDENVWRDARYAQMWDEYEALP